MSAARAAANRKPASLWFVFIGEGHHLRYRHENDPPLLSHRTHPDWRQRRQRLRLLSDATLLSRRVLPRRLHAVLHGLLPAPLCRRRVDRRLLPSRPLGAPALALNAESDANPAGHDPAGFFARLARKNSSPCTPRAKNLSPWAPHAKNNSSPCLTYSTF